MPGPEKKVSDKILGWDAFVELDVNATILYSNKIELELDRSIYRQI